MNIRHFLLICLLAITQSGNAAFVRAIGTANRTYSTAAPAVLTSLNPQKFPNLTRFVEQHAMLPACAQKAFEGVVQNPLTPNEVRKVQGEEKSYYIKTRFVFNRLILSQRIAECIKEHNLTCLTAPKKYLGYAHGTWYAIAQEAQGSTNPHLDMKTMKELVTIVEETGLCDLHGQNMLHHNGKITFIDTELSSRFALDSLCGLLRTSKKLPLSPAARCWIYQHTVKQIVGKKEEHTKNYTSEKQRDIKTLFKEVQEHSQETTGTCLLFNIGATSIVPVNA